MQILDSDNWAFAAFATGFDNQIQVDQMIQTGRIYLVGVLVAAWAILGATPPALSADLGAGPPPIPEAALPSRQWTLSFTPYGWMPGLSGNTTAKGRTTDIDVGPFRVLEHIDGVPGMGYAEARNGPFALYSDIIYAPLSVGASRGRSFDRLSLDVSGGVDIRETIIEAGAAYEIGKWRLFTGWAAVDLLAGARYWRESADINLAYSIRHSHSA